MCAEERGVYQRSHFSESGSEVDVCVVGIGYAEGVEHGFGEGVGFLGDVDVFGGSVWVEEALETATYVCEEALEFVDCVF